MSRLPNQSLPIERPQVGRRRGIVDPSSIVEFEKKDGTRGTPGQILTVIYDLIHGANINDPPAWRTRSYADMKMSYASPPIVLGRIFG